MRRAALRSSANDAEAHVTARRSSRTRPAGTRKRWRRSSARSAAARTTPKRVLGIGDAYEGQGRAGDAEAMYRKRRRPAARHPRATMRYGAFCYRQGASPTLPATSGRATGAPSGVSRSRMVEPRRRAASRSASMTEALAALQKSIALNLSERTGYRTSARCSSRSAATTMRGRSFEQATQLAPSDFVMWANLGDARPLGCRTASACE